jgi:membrane-associated protease RseP (regulator of RpoE activity)
MDPHPYRLALSCLDTPPAPEPPRKRQFPIEALVLLCAFVAAGTGIATLHAVGHGGHVEIGPAALAHVKKTKPIEKHPRPRVERAASSAIAQAPLLRGGAHDGKTLLATAKQLEALGLDVTVADVELAKMEWSAKSMWPARFVSVHGPGGHVDGVELQGIPLDSPLRAAGLAEGDQLLAINGYSFADDTIEQGTSLMQARNLGWTVVEIARGDHHVVLSIRWQVR